MGTDLNTVHDGPCTCGKGRYVVTSCSPDHAYARDRLTWWDSKIECPDCTQKFALVHQAGAICRVARADEAQRAEAAKASQAKLQEIQAHSEKAGHYEAIAAWLSGIPTVAEVHRALAGILLPSSRSAFGKEYKRWDKTTWARRNIHYHSLPAVLQLMGRPDPRITQLLEEARSLSSQSGREPTVLEVVCRVRQNEEQKPTGG